MHVALLTESRYLAPQPGVAYVENIFLEDRLLSEALAHNGASVERVDWADDSVNWGRFSAAIFRTTWDWSDRLPAFRSWLDGMPAPLLNDRRLAAWNLDKHYLVELAGRGVPIVPTHIVERGQPQSLASVLSRAGWSDAVAKPALSAGGRETWRVGPVTAADEARFARLVAVEPMLVQPFVADVLEGGELSIVVIDGVATHAVRKRAAPGEFRVQDDFGGSVVIADAASDELEVAERAVAACPFPPLYARVDLVRGPRGEPWLSELEVVEPELFLRFHPAAAERLAAAAVARLGSARRPHTPIQ